MRFSRQLRLPEVGEIGQQAIEKSRILIVGMGGLGCPAAQYLIAAGVGCLGIMDGDRVDESNLHRQILFSAQDINRPKVEAAAERLKLMSHTAKINAYFEPLSAANINFLLENYDVILDCTDNFEAKYLLNDFCVSRKKTLISASATGFEAYLMIVADNGPCLRCLYPQVKTSDVGSCNLSGILGAFVGIVGSWLAAETLKEILIRARVNGNLSSSCGKVLFFDFYDSRTRSVSIKKNPECVCSIQHYNLDKTRLDSHFNTQPKESLYLTKDQLLALGDYILVDVRSTDERELSQKFENTKFIHKPYLEIVSEAQLDQELWDADQKYVLFCSSGRRAAVAAQWLRDHGVKAAYSLRSEV
jgi:adenylyltransferase/sulfurtransferase